MVTTAKHPEQASRNQTFVFYIAMTENLKKCEICLLCSLEIRKMVVKNIMRPRVNEFCCMLCTNSIVVIVVSLWSPPRMPTPPEVMRVMNLLTTDITEIRRKILCDTHTTTLDCSTCRLCNIWTWKIKFINRCIIIYWHIYDGPCSGLNTGYYTLSIDGGEIDETMSTSSYYPEKAA